MVVPILSREDFVYIPRTQISVFAGCAQGFKVPDRNVRYLTRDAEK